MRQGAIAILCLLFISCGANDLGRVPITTSPGGAAPDISKMKLNKAFKTKYKRLDLRCDFIAELTRPKSNNSAHIITIERSFVIWDIKNEFAKTKELLFEYDFKNIEADIELNLETGLLPSHIETISKGNEDLIYKLRNAAMAEGTFAVTIVETYVDGSFGKTNSQNNSFKVIDRLNSGAIKMEWGPNRSELWSTKLEINCTLDAKADSRFRNDFIVERKKKKDQKP